MSIMWKYLDKRSAPIAAIKDYDAMQFIINSTDDEIKRTYEKMTSVGSPKWDGMPHAHNPNAGEERLFAEHRDLKDEAQTITRPDKPGKPKKPGRPSSSPGTGDSSDLYGLTACIAFCAIGIVGAALYKKRRAD